MAYFRSRILPVLTVGVLAGLAIAAPGCEGPLSDFCYDIGLVCPDQGIVDGNAKVSGLVNVDAYFSAVLEVRDAGLLASSTVRVEIEGLAASLGIPDYADLPLVTVTALVTAALGTKFDDTLQAGLTIRFEPVQCEASLVAAEAMAAECDLTIDPATMKASCEGTCEVSSEIAIDCAAIGTLECIGRAPGFVCEGSCSGACQLPSPTTCDGTCNGTCEAECSACTGGVCETDAQGFVSNCIGSCSGDCRGTCELEAGGACADRCEGSCTYNPGVDGECEPGATAKCDVTEMADATCLSHCEGTIEPPEVSRECRAAVEAKTRARIECSSPSLSVEYQFVAGIDPDTQAEFEIWLEDFERRFAKLLTAAAKLEHLEDAAAGLVLDASGPVEEAFEEIANGDLDLKSAVGIGCALDELESVGDALAHPHAEIEASLSATTEVVAAVGG